MKMCLHCFNMNGVLVIQVYGFAAGGTDYILAVDVDFTDRSLVTKEQVALEQIFDQ